MRIDFDGLPDDVCKLLSGAAVLGREFDPALAGAILGRGASWQRPASAQAVRHGAVVPCPDDARKLVFADDRLHRAAVASLPERERRRLHLRAAEALAAMPGDHVYEIADQSIASGETEQTTRRALAAGRAAAVRGAADVAERYFREAQRAAADEAPDLALEIAEALASAQLARGRADLAAEQLGEAARIAREPGRRAEITATLAGLEAELGDRKAALGSAEASLADLGGRLPGRGPLLVLALVAEILSRAFQTLRRRPRGAQIARQAGLHNLLADLYAAEDRRLASFWSQLRGLRLAESGQPDRILVEALSGYARALSAARLRPAALAIARRALSWAQALPDTGLTADALTLEGELLYGSGNSRSAAARFGEAAALLGGEGESAGRSRSSQVGGDLERALLGRGYCEYRLGRLADARTTAAALGRLAAEAERQELVWAARGLWLKAADGADRTGIVRQPAGEPVGSAIVREARALELLGALRPSTAAEILGRDGDAQAAAPGGWGGLPEAESLASSAAWLASAMRQAIEADAPGDGPLERARLHEARRAARRALRLARRRRSNLPHALRELGLIEVLEGRAWLGSRRLRRSLRVSVRQSAREEHALALAGLDHVGHTAGAGGRTADPGQPQALILPAGRAPRADDRRTRAAARSRGSGRRRRAGQHAPVRRPRDLERDHRRGDPRSRRAGRTPPARRPPDAPRAGRLGPRRRGRQRLLRRRRRVARARLQSPRPGGSAPAPGGRRVVWRNRRQRGRCPNARAGGNRRDAVRADRGRRVVTSCLYVESRAGRGGLRAEELRLRGVRRRDGRHGARGAEGFAQVESSAVRSSSGSRSAQPSWPTPTASSTSRSSG